MEQKKLLSEFQTPNFNDWIKEAELSNNGKPIDKLITKTVEGIDFFPIYTQKDMEEIAHLQNNLPGFFPYIRSSNHSGYKAKAWNIAQEISYCKPADFNTLLSYLISHGLNSVIIPEAFLKQISTFNDFCELFKNIELNGLLIYFQVGNETISKIHLLTEFFEKSNIAKGGILFDPISFAEKDGCGTAAVSNAIDKLVDLTSNDIFSKSKAKTIAIDGSIYGNAGASAVQEIAYSLSKAVQYIREFQKKSFDINTFSNKIFFRLSTGTNFFVEVAKFRAIRALWAKIAKEFGGNEEAQKMFLHSDAWACNKSILDVHQNIIRNTGEALSAVLGGCDSINLAPFDSNVNLQNEDSYRLSLNTQHILKDECNLTEVIDPAGGSWFVEYLTDQLSKRSWQIFQTVEANGGWLKSLESGMPQDEVKKVSDTRDKNYKTRKEVLVGTNKNPNIYENEKYLRNNPTFAEEPHPAEIKSFKKVRYSEPFEAMRLNALNFKDKHNSFPKVFFATMGPLKQHKPRADFSNDFFRVAGFEPIYPNGFNTIDDAVAEFSKSDAKCVVICSTDDTYPDIVPELTKKVKTVKPDSKVIVAGYPTEHIEAFKAAGVDDFIHIKADIHGVLSKLQNDLKIF